LKAPLTVKEERQKKERKKEKEKERKKQKIILLRILH
jgi:hypothetical protein